MQLHRGHPRYMRGIFEFIEFVRGKTSPGQLFHICPCGKCRNRSANSVTFEDMYVHLSQYGICPSYTTWTWHGEASEHMPTLVDIQAQRNQGESSSSANFGDPGVMNFLNDAFPSASAYDGSVPQDNNNTTFPDVSQVGSSGYDSYNKLMQQAQTPLYPGSEHTVLETVMKQMSIKKKRNKTVACFNDDIALLKELLPADNNCPENYDKVKSILSEFGLEYIKIDACVNNCILYYKGYKDAFECPHCYEPRYEPHARSRQTNPIPRKVLRYFPLGPRLQRLYMSSHTAKHMRWHHERHQQEPDRPRVDPDNLTHPADGEAWNHFDRSFPDFASECRNVRLGLATDGFNPTGDMNNSYSIWPVIAFPLNLPPNMCMRTEYNFLTMLVPGKYSPGKCLDVYMRPLIDELLQLYENGIHTFDRYSQTYFFMRVAVLFTVNDFPAYGMMSGQTTHGYKACPVCIDEVNSSHHAHRIVYLGSRRWLPPDHPWRYDAQAFDGTVEHGPKPEGRSGQWILDMLNQHWFGILSSARYVNDQNPPTPEEFKYWTHRSSFFELPYWSTLKIRHNLDVMHIEKNVCDSILGTILDIKDKTKDTAKARADLQKMGIRRKLWIKLNKKTGKHVMPQAGYTVVPNKRSEIFKWLREVKYPSGYAGNIARYIKMGENKIIGLKTHDCHVLLQRLLPVVIRPYLQSDVVDTLVALSNFFQRLCAKELKKSEVRSLQDDIAYIMCKLERIFPPTFFSIMVHLMIHLPEQVLLTGPVQYTWCYPNERYVCSLYFCQ